MTIKHLYPNARPSLDLKFAKDKVLDPRITYSRASSGTYFDSTGTLQSAGTNQPRFDHDSVTGESLGLLLEEARTNGDSASATLNTSWAATNATFADQTITTPDGTTTAKLLTEDTSTDKHRVGRFYDNIYTGHALSFFVKPNGRTKFRIKLDTTAADQPVDFDLANMIVTPGATNRSGAIQKLPNGWYRVSAVVVGPYRGYCNLTLLDNSGNETYTGDGTSGVYLWGVQYEKAAPYSSSYIPTSGSTVTRAADVATVTNSNVYDTDSFTIINQPFGSSAGASELTLFDGPEPIKRVSIYDQNLSQATINTVAKKTDEFWRWRILGSSFALPNFATDGQVTVDWGDGTVETLTTSEHTFSNGGGYHDIGFRLNSGTYFSPYINDNANHDTKVVAVGPAPVSMKLNAHRVFHGCSNLEAFDATVDTSSSTIFQDAWRGCSSLTSFPLIDTSAGTTFQAAWRDCSSFESFPLIDTSSGTTFQVAWQNCSSLTSFPLIDTSSGTGFYSTWAACSSLTSFPLIDTSSGTTFLSAWRNCSSLTDFPANFFDSWSPASVANQCFYLTWDGCSSLTPASVVNILDSIAASGQSAPSGTGTNDKKITIDWDGTGTPATTAAAAITTLKSRNWEIYLNGVLQ